MKPNKIIFALLLFSASLFSQADKGQWITVRAVADSLPATNVKVVNIVNEQTAVSNADGEFRIQAKAGDMLVFPTENFEYKRFLIDEETLKKSVVTVVLTARAIQLDEVTIHRDIDAETMGFVPKGQKKYTPAERKVYSATSGPVDIIVNGLTGRTKMLRKGVAVERRERLMERLEIQFEEEFYTDRLRIPADYIKGFRFFLLDDKDVVAALDARNKPALMERVLQLAPSYLDLIRPQFEEDEKKK